MRIAIDAIYYINLDHRSDRRTSIEKQIANLCGTDNSHIDFTRIPAIYVKGFGIYGCGLSHIKALETFISSPHNTCIIFEDDFIFTQDMNTCQSMIQRFLEEMKNDWDIIMLSSNTQMAIPVNDYLHKCIETQTTSGYMINRSFATKLLSNFREGVQLLEQSRKPYNHALDIYWKTLQPHSRWFIFNPKLGIQMPNFSDIEEKEVNYNV